MSLPSRRTAAAAAADAGPSVVDRTVRAVLPSPDETPSRKDGVSPQTERLHRLHGTSLIHGACRFLRLAGSTYATGCTVFHRFYHRASLRRYDVWSVAMASTLLAIKVEEENACSLGVVVAVFAHHFRKRVLLAGLNGDVCRSVTRYAATCNSDGARCLYRLSEAEKERLLQSLPPVARIGPLYDEWKKCLAEMENTVLRQLGFTLYWIPDSHPHKFILYFLQVLLARDNGTDDDDDGKDKDDKDNELSRTAWNYCNDTCRLDLCVRYLPEVVACAAIYLAALWHETVLPVRPVPWWEVFCGPGHDAHIATIANAVLGLDVPEHDDDDDDDNGGLGEDRASQIAAAEFGFLKPLVQGTPCFNDADSFVWYQLEESFANAAASCGMGGS